MMEFAVIRTGAVEFFIGVGFIAEFFISLIQRHDGGQPGELGLRILVIDVRRAAAGQGDPDRFLFENRFVIDLAGDGVDDRGPEPVGHFDHAVFMPEIGLGGVMTNQVARGLASGWAGIWKSAPKSFLRS